MSGLSYHLRPWPKTKGLTTLVTGARGQQSCYPSGWQVDLEMDGIQGGCLWSQISQLSVVTKRLLKQTILRI